MEIDFGDKRKSKPSVAAAVADTQRPLRRQTVRRAGSASLAKGCPVRVGRARGEGRGLLRALRRALLASSARGAGVVARQRLVGTKVTRRAGLEVRFKACVALTAPHSASLALCVGAALHARHAQLATVLVH